MDSRLLELRKKLYCPEKTFRHMLKKHYKKECNCKKKGKVCNVTEFLDSFPINWVKDNMNKLYALYPVMQSTTQSLRCKTGKTFESCFEQLLKERKFKKGIHYSREIFITEDDKRMYNKCPKGKKGHKVDFVFPAPKDGELVCNFKGYICSMKTTLRERWLQDLSFCGTKLVLISLERKNSNNIRSIKVQNGGTELEDFITEISKLNL